AVITVGYFYGILRANFFVTASHFIFDCAVLGFYCARFKDLARIFVTTDGQRLKHWVTFLIAVPVVLFFVPLQDPLVQLVGLRGNAFLLPFLLVGARLTRDDFYRIGIWLVFLNLAAFAVGSAEYLFGIEHFFPYNAITELIYRSNDVGAANDYRIPSIFSNAHSFGGTMVLTVPLLAGAWVQKHRQIWHKNLFIAGLLATMLGVFMSAARSHFLAMAVLLAVATFSTRLRPIYRVGWIVVILLVGYIVGTHERMQRFTTLGNREFVQSRFQASVNETLLDVMVDYPFGNGLGGGGTSIPFFLLDRVNMPVAVESEWGRIVLETGLFGLAGWAGFLLWVFTRPQAHRDDPAFLGCRLAWVAALTFFAFGFIGIGLFTSIPSTTILLILVGWIATHHTGEADQRLPVRQPVGIDPRLALALRQRGLAQRG
ncbi:MAG: O-antigen ligase family protein, partial [Terriglobales bacterium]